MGCDIHLFVEYKHYDSWRPYGYCEFLLNRNYLMFGMMADGVRQSPEFSFVPRGLPDDVSTTVDGANKLYVSDESDKYTSIEAAKRYERHGSEITYRDGKPIWVTHPDWHSHSWLTKEEYDQVIGNYEWNGNKNPGIDYQVLQSILETLVENGHEARIVFWFDN